MNPEAISILFLIGAVQAILLLIGINLSQPFGTALKKVASLLLLNITLMMVYYIVFLTGNELIYPYIDSLGSAAWMAMFPLYYLLCLALTRPKFKLKLKHWLFFIFSLIFILEEIVNSIGLAPNIYSILNNTQQFLDLWMFVFFTSGTYFALKSLKEIKTNTNLLRIRELHFFSYAFLGVLLFFGITYWVLRANYTYTFEFILISILEIFVFVLFYRVFKFSSIKDVLGEATYTNGISAAIDFNETAVKLETLMQKEKPYLEQNLTLNQLAEMSEISANRLSQLFSVHYNSSFYEYVNSHRLNHLEHLLNDSNKNRFTILAMAEMSGFKSKATFYKAFKAKHGMSPGEYVKS